MLQCRAGPAEKNYGMGEQELLVVVQALAVWRCYLEGFPGGVQVLTGYAPNTFLLAKQGLSRRQARWSEYLQRLDVTWLYKPGKVNVADPLSLSPLSLAACCSSRLRCLQRRP